LMSGVNRLPPVGLMTFSVGDGGAALEGVVVIVVVVGVEGACSPLLPHPARSAPIAISAPPPITATRREVNGFELICSELAMRLLSTSYAIEFQCNSQRPRSLLQAADRVGATE
jgi:hypothetical protein